MVVFAIIIIDIEEPLTYYTVASKEPYFLVDAYDESDSEMNESKSAQPTGMKLSYLTNL